MRLLSYSQISTFQQCPLRYRLEYIDGIPTPPRSYLSFGTSLHSAVEFFYKNRLVPPSRQELLAELDRVWESEGYRSDDEEQQYKGEARAILNRFWFIYASPFRPAAATEQPFELDLGGVGLRGVIDRVDECPDGAGLHITDYKSGKWVWDEAELQANLQLTLYQLAAEQLWNQPVRRLSLYHLRTNRPYTVAGRDPATIARARELVFQVAEEIESSLQTGDFAPRYGRFCPCEFVRYCPVFAGQPPAMPEPRSVAPAETTSVAQVSIQAELLLVSSP